MEALLPPLLGLSQVFNKWLIIIIAIEVTIQLGWGQKLIHSNYSHVAILSGKKHGWYGLFVFHNTF